MEPVQPETQEKGCISSSNLTLNFNPKNITATKLFGACKHYLTSFLPCVFILLFLIYIPIRLNYDTFSHDLIIT